MKRHVLLLMLVPLVGFVAADTGKLFGKLTKAYKDSGESDDMGAEMAKGQSESMATGDDNDDGGRVVKPTKEQSLPLEQRYNPFFGNPFTKVTSYGLGWYPSYGGMVYDENRMRMDVSHPNMRVNMDGNLHQNVVP